MKFDFDVENIKCGGCAGTIKKRLLSNEDIASVEVDVAQGLVSIEAEVDNSDAWRAELLGMGYPEKGTAEGMAAAKAKAKSFVSCAVGRVDQVINK
ncbi:MAG: heavy-metal-associated domain-containing protein [Gammaproteobacteria bacterium]|nr:heavy-metal-associated domain-containing protein [Gammaproteobacteria bacterium]